MLFFPENAAAPSSLKTAAPLDFSTSDLPTMHNAWLKSKQQSSVHIPNCSLDMHREVLEAQFLDVEPLEGVGHMLHFVCMQLTSGTSSCEVDHHG